MRLGIDCIDVLPDYSGGVNTYIFGLIHGFQHLKPNDINFVIFCTSKNKHLFEIFIDEESFQLIIIENLKTTFRKLLLAIAFIFNSVSLWRFLSNLHTKSMGINAIIETNCDILYTGTTTLNIYNLSIPTFLSMHDIQYVHYPEFFSKKQLKILNFTFLNSAKSASFFQASSIFIKNDLMNNFSSLNENQIYVIPEGVNIANFSTPPALDILSKYSLPDKFLFFPAQLWKHKNHISVLKALKEIELESRVKIPMVLTGARFSASDDIFNYIKENNMDYVSYLGKVPFNELLALYHTAKYLITAVLYESSSLPILEAAASNLPIIASKTPPNIELSEVLQINLFEPLNIDDIKRVVLNCWNNIDKIKIQSNFNYEKIEYYSWENIARKYVDSIKLIINVTRN
jgi:glycosyltransferase involved in cell wall biosynthesis